MDNAIELLEEDGKRFLLVVARHDDGNDRHDVLPRVRVVVAIATKGVFAVHVDLPLLFSTFATESRMNPVARLRPHRNINDAASMAVGKRGTRPVWKYSTTMGMPKARPITANRSATRLKNFSGR